MSEIDPLLGETLAGHHIEARIGTGATGVVYRATKDGGARAIKVLNEAFAKLKPLQRRFDREGRALERLKHPHIVEVLEIGIDAGRAFIAMELLDGDTLEQRMQKGAVTPDDALRWIRQILAALAYAHEQKIVHRDLKPANVMLVGPRSDVKLLDFGLAKFLAIDEISHDGALTRRGRVVGTPAYLAPEQVSATGTMDERVDVYSAGVLLFELLADRRPFDYGKRAEMLRAHVSEPPPLLAEKCPGLRVEPALEAVVRRSLEKEPESRYASAAEMLEALSGFDGSAVTVPTVVAVGAPRSPEGDPPTKDSGETMQEETTDEQAPAPAIEDATSAVEPPAVESTSAAGSRVETWVTLAVWLAGLVGLLAIIALVAHAASAQ